MSPKVRSIRVGLLRSLSVLCVFCAVLVLAASDANAQSVANIRGRVTDDTGGALPGVTIAVTSPAMLLPEIVGVTDTEGGYSFPDLPIGQYRLSYELPGFQRFVREQIELTAGFTATINVTLKLGAIEETVTVTGASPVVDIASTTPRSSLSAKVLTDVIPATRTLQDVAASTPGVMPARANLGGGTNTGGNYSSAYGISAQNTILVDGVNTRQGTGSSGTGPDLTSIEELQVVTIAGGADQALPGVALRMIVKSGGNTFSGRYEAQGQHHRFQSDNLPKELRAQGVNVGDTTLHNAEYTGDLGGRLIRDKLWFYTALRYQNSDRTTLGFVKDRGPDGIYGTADDVPGTRPATLDNQTVKITYQAARNYKIIGLYTRNGEKFPSGISTSRTTPFEATSAFYWNPNEQKVELLGMPSDRLVFNVFLGRHYYDADYLPQEAFANLPASFDNTTRFNTGVSLNNVRRPRESWQPEGSVSFFAGDHEVKAGFSLYRQYQGDVTLAGLHGSYRLIFDTVSGVAQQPFQIQTYNYPVNPRNNLNEGGFYVQDTWRVGGRTTLNLGLRVDTFDTWVPAQTKEEGQFSSAGSFPRIDTGTWRELAPRLGLAYDLAGDGKTVLKATFGLYNHTPSDAFPAAYNKNAPATTTYRWRDLNGNRDYDPGEVNLDTDGADFISISGSANNIINPELRNTTTREFTIGVERELMADFGARLSYYYLRTSDLYENVNVLRPYSVYTTALTRQDPGSDGVAGTPDDGGIVTVYDYPAALRGSRFVGNQRTNRSPEQDNSNQVIEVAVTRRATGRWGLIGSFSAQKNHQWLSGIPASPNDEYFNLDETWDWQGRLTSNYDLPWNLSLSGMYVIFNGVQGQRTVLFRGIPSASTVTLRMEPYGTQSGPVRPLLNLRVAKAIAGVGTSGQLRLSLEILNALNSAAPWSISWLSGPTFGQVNQTDQARILRGIVTYSF